jgi:hypothetical protein
MLRQILETKKAKPKFQVLFLHNDAARQVDFLTIKEHLEHGESVFITSKPSQKLNEPKPKAKGPIGMKTRLSTAFNLESA